jgi:hypothetical protein
MMDLKILKNLLEQELIDDHQDQAFKEACELLENYLLEESDNNDYKKFFKQQMDKKGIKNINDLSKKEKKEFFSKIDDMWMSKKEKKESDNVDDVLENSFIAYNRI